MALMMLTFLLVLAFFYSSKFFVYALMVFYVLFDMLDGFYEDEKIFAALRYLVPFALILFIIIKHGMIQRRDAPILIIGFYLLVLLVYSRGDVIISAKTTLAVLLSFLMIPLGRYYGSRNDFLGEFENFNRFLLIALPLYIVVVNIAGIGQSYSDAFTTGFLITSRMYIFPIVVFLAIHYVVSNKSRSKVLKTVDLTLIAVNIGIIIINTRRTAMGMLLVALVIYALLNRRLILKMAILVVLLVTSLILTYPLYEDTLQAQMQKRERIKDLDTYEEEGRYLETLYIMDYHSHKQSISEVLFGVKLFDTYDFGQRYFGRDRPIHSDLNMVFYSAGLVGVLLFAFFVMFYFIFGNSQVDSVYRSVYFPVLAMFLIVLIPGRFIGTMTYAPLLMLLLTAVKYQTSVEVAPLDVATELKPSVLQL